MNISGIILAGGKSKRMGRNKALLEIGGISMIERVAGVLAQHCSEILVAGENIELNRMGFHIVPDIYPGCGPLGGIHAGLTAAQNRFSFTAACDIPFLDGGLMRRMILEIEDNCAAVVLKTGQYLEMLFSIYSKEFARAAETCIKNGVYKITAALSLVRWKAVEVDLAEFPDLKKILMNVNTPEDYEEAKKIDELG
ncbi:MAG: molybdenum cofactor guanylyltransferase [Peptococcaceae bacterium]|nr:molybdenum cofactor guanylyltransferase [Peptococcaceae bacterium]